MRQKYSTWPQDRREQEEVKAEEKEPKSSEEESRKSYLGTTWEMEGIVEASRGRAPLITQDSSASKTRLTVWVQPSGPPGVISSCIL